MNLLAKIPGDDMLFAVYRYLSIAATLGKWPQQTFIAFIWKNNLVEIAKRLAKRRSAA